MGDTSTTMLPSTLLPQNVLRNLADKLYEKRKNAALEVEAVVKQLNLQGDHERVHAVISLLINDFAMSPQANHRKGGLIGLAAATVGLASDAAQHLEKIVPPVLASFVDQDSRVRYYACEALYNIAKVSRGEFIVFFNDVFDALCKLSADIDPNVQNAAHLLDRLVKDIVTESDQFSIEEFIPLLRERMNVLNPFVRQFLVGWITVLDSVPDIDMLGFLPDFLDGLFNMLGDSNHEIRVQADSALREFLQEIKNAPSVEYGKMAEILVQRAGSSEEFTRLTAITWIHEFVKLGGRHLVPYYAAVLGAVLPCISDKEEKIRAVAKETNDEQLQRVGSHTVSEGFDIGAVLAVARRELGSEWEATRLEALRWIAVLLERYRGEVLHYLDDASMQLFDALLHSLSDTSDEVVVLVLEVQACIARDPHHFHRLMVLLARRFDADRTLLEKRGSLALRQLCVLLDAEKIYRELAHILEGESDVEFATIMVQALNLILLTAPELAKMRALIKQSLSSEDGRELYAALYSTWCHSPVATVSLCLLAQAYEHASAVIFCLDEEDVNVNLLVQVDKLVHLLETPIFAFLRLQLLEPGRNPALLKALYGLLMLLPQQSSAFKILRTRLKSVPMHALIHMAPTPTPVPAAAPTPAFAPTPVPAHLHSSAEGRKQTREDAAVAAGDVNFSHSYSSPSQGGAGDNEVQGQGVKESPRPRSRSPKGGTAGGHGSSPPPQQASREGRDGSFGAEAAGAGDAAGLPPADSWRQSPPPTASGSGSGEGEKPGHGAARAHRREQPPPRSHDNWVAGALSPPQGSPRSVAADEGGGRAGAGAGAGAGGGGRGGGGAWGGAGAGEPGGESLDFTEKLRQFEAVQAQHRQHRQQVALLAHQRRLALAASSSSAASASAASSKIVDGPKYEEARARGSSYSRSPEDSFQRGPLFVDFQARASPHSPPWRGPPQQIM